MNAGRLDEARTAYSACAGGDARQRGALPRARDGRTAAAAMRRRRSSSSIARSPLTRPMRCRSRRRESRSRSVAISRARKRRYRECRDRGSVLRLRQEGRSGGSQGTRLATARGVSRAVVGRADHARRSGRAYRHPPRGCAAAPRQARASSPPIPVGTGRRRGYRRWWPRPRDARLRQSPFQPRAPLRRVDLAEAVSALLRVIAAYASGAAGSASPRARHQRHERVAPELSGSRPPRCPPGSFRCWTRGRFDIERPVSGAEAIAADRTAPRARAVALTARALPDARQSDHDSRESC